MNIFKKWKYKLEDKMDSVRYEINELKDLKKDLKDKKIKVSMPKKLKWWQMFLITLIGMHLLLTLIGLIFF